jgi:hypothetical protein
MGHLYKLTFLVGYDRYAANEGAAFDLSTAARLVAGRMCVIDPSEPERAALEEAARFYKKPAPPKPVELPPVSNRWLWRYGQS